MVSNPNKKPISDDYKHTRQVDHVSYVASSDVKDSCQTPFASGGEIDTKKVQVHGKPIIDWHNEHVVMEDKNFGSRRDFIIPDDHPVGDFNYLKRSNGNGDDFFCTNTSKRSLDFDESCQLAWKRSRQVDDFNTYYNEVCRSDYIPGGPRISDPEKQSGECGDFNAKMSVNLEDVIGKYPYVMPNMSCYLEIDGEKIGTEPSSECVQRLFSDVYPRKHVALGPDHQVNIPAYAGPSNAQNSDMEKFMGTCIIPMPDACPELHNDGEENGHSSLSCGCIYQGSMDCIRKHVNEAREELRETVGSHKFSGLGFSNMGEDVALKWTDEDEHAFQQIVYSHPASHGKNFWSILPQVFPSRSSKDLVSYYFNVFILRKRAAQNRCDPMNVDSDNDEWQGRNDGQLNLEEYEEDSAVESPVYNGVYEHQHEEDEEEESLHVLDDEVDMSDDDYGIASDGKNQVDANVYEGCLNYKSISTKRVESLENYSNVVENDLQDDSCTSYEVQHSGGDSHGSNETSAARSDAIEGTRHKNEQYENGSSNHLPNPEYAADCEQKPWESYFSMSGKVLDFFPTCNVIEEVFREEDT